MPRTHQIYPGVHQALCCALAVQLPLCLPARHARTRCRSLPYVPPWIRRRSKLRKPPRMPSCMHSADAPVLLPKLEGKTGGKPHAKVRYLPAWSKAAACMLAVHHVEADAHCSCLELVGHALPCWKTCSDVTVTWCSVWRRSA